MGKSSALGYILSVMSGLGLPLSLGFADGTLGISTQLNRTVSGDSLMGGTPLMDVWMSELHDRCKIPYKFEESVLVDPSFRKRWDTSIFFSYNELEIRYLVSWLLHFAGCTANIAANGILVSTSDETRKGDSVFDCYTEKTGDWSNRLTQSLDRPWRTGETNITLRELIVHSQIIRGARGGTDWTARLESPSFLIDPGVPAQTVLNATLHLSSETNNYRQVLASALRQVELEFRIQGGVIYIVKPENKRAPNTLSDRIR